MATPTSLPATFVAGNVLTAAQMNDLRGAFRILQVVSVVMNAAWSASIASTARAAITDLAATITPSSTDSQVLIMSMVNGTSTSVGRLTLGIDRNGTDLGTWTSAGNRTGIFSQNVTDEGAGLSVPMSSNTVIYVDSPASTSALTYQMDFQNISGSTKTCYVNRGITDTDNSSYSRALSTITLMEISA
jgi:hypothetical protein